MTYAREREDFLMAMQREGVPEDVARLVLRHAATVQRYAEAACNGENPYHGAGAVTDYRCVACGETFPSWFVVAKHYGADGRRAGMCRDCRAQRRIVTLLAPYHVAAVFSGDPRGACVKLRVPSGRTNDWGEVGLCVPTRA